MMMLERCFGGLALLAALITPVHAGSIAGTVRAAPPALAANGAGAGAYESRRYKFVEKIDYDRLRDFVVYIDQVVPGAAEAPAEKVVTTTQKDANFEPHVLPVAVGTTVLWPNEDDIFHNVFSMSDPAPFDLGYYKREKVPKVTFERPGRVDVHCAIHTKMHCIILVVPNRFFAKADEKGRFTIAEVPPGTYKVRAWHERFPSKVLGVVVPPAGAAKVDFVLSLGDLPKR
ncbi:MAG: carboxypeptidase regulatory-like domain-containing protein [Opitutaceae bacterium]|nr:carboxypeptidase regulatory-like domain-containing protein [Opitutaceae bacterium]